MRIVKMAVDDENSIYVGGLPYDCTEDSVRHAFEMYGHIISIKIVNDREVGGKCYGFVTFSNPCSAINAIDDMDGRTIGGRSVRVNEVRSRTSRQSFGRESYFREWERVRDGDRDRDRDRDRHRYEDQDVDREHDRERNREWDHNKEFKYRNRLGDRDRERYEDQNVDREPDRERNREWDHNKEFKYKSRLSVGPHTSPKEQRISTSALLSPFGRFRDERDHCVEVKSLSGSSSERKRKAASSPPAKRHERMETNENANIRKLKDSLACEDTMKTREELDAAKQRRDELMYKVALLDEQYKTKQSDISELQRKSQKTDGAVRTSKKKTEQRQMQLKKLQDCYLQVKEHSEKVKSSEQELQSLVDAIVLDLNDLN